LGLIILGIISAAGERRGEEVEQIEMPYT